jgi:hypothetical protein
MVLKRKPILSILFVLVIVLVSPLGVAASPSFTLPTYYNDYSEIQNSSFENYDSTNRFSDWDEYPSTAWNQTSTHYEYGYAAFGYRDTGDLVYMCQSLHPSTLEDLADRTAEFSFWFKADTSGTYQTRAKANITWYDDNGYDSECTSYLDGSSDSSKPWKQVSVQATFSGKPDYVTVYIYGDAPSGKKTRLFVDDARITILHKNSVSNPNYGRAVLTCNVWQVDTYQGIQAIIDIAISGYRKDGTNYRIYSVSLKAEMLPLTTPPHGPTYTLQEGEVSITNLGQSNDRDFKIHSTTDALSNVLSEYIQHHISVFKYHFGQNPLIIAYIEYLFGPHTHAYGVQLGGMHYWTQFDWLYGWQQARVTDDSVNTVTCGHRIRWRFRPASGVAVRITATVTWARLESYWVWPFGPWTYLTVPVGSTTVTTIINAASYSYGA